MFFKRTNEVVEGDEHKGKPARPVFETASVVIQRVSDIGGIEEEGNEGLRAKCLSDAAPPRIHDLKGKGVPLSKDLRDFYEPRFGHDFGGVRVHTSPEAFESSRALNALAFTSGRDIAFARGRFSPGTSTGRRLLAHELTHVVQQGGGSKPGNSDIRESTAGGTGPERAPLGVIQRAQDGRIRTPTGGGAPHFVWIVERGNTYSGLASRYGVLAIAVQSFPGNPRALPSAGNRVKIPAFHPPAANTASVLGSRSAGITGATAVNFRWNAHATANRIGRVTLGTPVQVLGGVTGDFKAVWITNNARMTNDAVGIIEELRLRGHVAGNDIFGYVHKDYVPPIEVTGESVVPATGITAFGQQVRIRMTIPRPAAGFQGVWEIIDAAGNRAHACRVGLIRGRMSCTWDGLTRPGAAGYAGPLAGGGPFRSRILDNRGVPLHTSAGSFPVTTGFQAPGSFGGALNTAANRRILAQILTGEMSAPANQMEAMAVGWTVINRMLWRNTTDLDAAAPASQYNRRTASAAFTTLARRLLQGGIGDTTTGATYFFSPRSMPSAATRGCCTGNPAPCPAGTVPNNANCRGGLHTVPGTSPAQQRFFPDWAARYTLQPQPAGTRAMYIMVYRP